MLVRIIGGHFRTGLVSILDFMNNSMSLSEGCEIGGTVHVGSFMKTCLCNGIDTSRIIPLSAQLLLKQRKGNISSRLAPDELYSLSKHTKGNPYVICPFTLNIRSYIHIFIRTMYMKLPGFQYCRFINYLSVPFRM